MNSFKKELEKRHHFVLKFIQDHLEIWEKYKQTQEKSLGVEYKEDQSIVTLCDQELERNFRTQIHDHFPEDLVYGEEFLQENPKEDLLWKTSSKQFIWTIDTLDGTSSFFYSVPLFGSLYGLIYEGKVVYGLACLPALKEYFWAFEDSPVYYLAEENIQEIKVISSSDKKDKKDKNEEKSDKKKMLIVYSSVESFKKTHQFHLLTKLLEGPHVVRSWGDVFAYSLLLKNKASLVVDADLKLWDFIPLSLILKQAGFSYRTFENTTVSRPEGNIISGSQKDLSNFFGKE